MALILVWIISGLLFVLGFSSAIWWKSHSCWNSCPHSDYVSVYWILHIIHNKFYIVIRVSDRSNNLLINALHINFFNINWVLLMMYMN